MWFGPHVMYVTRALAVKYARIHRVLTQTRRGENANFLTTTKSTTQKYPSRAKKTKPNDVRRGSDRIGSNRLLSGRRNRVSSLLKKLGGGAPGLFARPIIDTRSTPGSLPYCRARRFSGGLLPLPNMPAPSVDIALDVTKRQSGKGGSIAPTAFFRAASYTYLGTPVPI